MTAHHALTLARLEAHVLRVPIAVPVRTSFGTMTSRPAVVVRAVDADGVTGWGEVWCNFPSCGAEHRARLVEGWAAEILTGRPFAGPADAYRELTARSRLLAIQAGEPGPFAQVVAGIDIALWDLTARRAGEPLWQLLGGSSPRVPVYASGLNPDRPQDLAAERQAQGYRAFKLKVGFGRERDLENLRALRAALGDDAALMVDANQAWEPAEAADMAAAMAPFRPVWLEEPVAADRPLSDWVALARRCPIPLAAGENLRGEEGFRDAIGSGAFGVVQPDLCKWGGFTGCLPVARAVLAAGLTYCPHYLGGGIGLVASAQLLAAAGGPGLLEVDANPNPLRDALAAPVPAPRDGHLVLPDTPGLGVEPDLPALARLCGSAA